MVIRFRILALGWLFFATSLLAQEKSRVLVPEVAPGQVGLSAEKLKLVDAAVDAIIEKKEIAGASVLIARKGKIAHFKTYGHQDLKAGKAMDRETIFRIYSMTKSIATSGALILHEEGKYQLDDPVEQYLPALARVRVMEGDQKVEPKRKMTVRDLMRHTAGMTYGFFGDTPVDALYREKKVLEGDMDQMVAKLGELPLVDHPGEKWVYSVSVDVLGKLIEVWSGQPFDVFLQKRIFEPLQMVDTAFHVPEAKLDRFAVNYGPGLSVIDDPATSQYRKKPSFLSGGGGL
ncbi:MAG: serine hydrolase domain-containing protein, partial [Verrucomicrobiota bacterium]